MKKIVTFIFTLLTAINGWGQPSTLAINTNGPYAYAILETIDDFKAYQLDPSPYFGHKIVRTLNSLMLSRQLTDVERDTVMTIADGINDQNLKMRIEAYYRDNKQMGVVLPPEIMNIIIYYISQGHPVGEIYRMLLVSKSVHFDLLSQPVRLDLTNSSFRITDEHLKKIVALFPMMRELTLYKYREHRDVGDPAYPRITDDGLVYLKELKQLTHLQLNGTRITDVGVEEHLKDLTQLTHLVLGDTFVTDKGMAYLTNLKQLTHLGLGFMLGLTDIGIAYISNFEQLTHLELGRTAISDAGLATLKNMLQLTDLNLSSTGISDEGVMHLYGLRQLTHLNLSDTGISDAGLTYLQNLTQLTHLDLSETGITDVGLTYLENLKQLTELNLSSTVISDEGVLHLNGLRQLSYLDLSNTFITDAGLTYLQNLPHLTELKLYDTSVTPEGVELLKNMKQQLTVYY